MADTQKVLPDISVNQKAALGLGLCDPRNLLTPEQRKRLSDDLAELAQQRRRAEAESRNIWMA